MQMSVINSARMDNVVKIHTPTSLGVYGPTQCGKTRFIVNLLKEANTMFTTSVQEIHYCYAVYQDLYTELQQCEGKSVEKVTFHEGMPSIEDCREWAYMKHHIVIVLDDLMTDLTKHPEMVKFATVDCHHKNITMVLLLHNIFPPGLRTVSLNIHYVVLFKNKRDTLQVETLGRRVMKNRVKYFFACFQQAVKKPFGYLLVDMHPHSDETYQLRTAILSYERPTVIYTPRK